jgi:serine/threonine protein kinase
LKICDFGLARPFLGEETPTAWTDYVATRWYRAPELCGCFYGIYSHAVDIWSIGCIFAETLLGKPLFPGRDAVAQLQIMTDLLGKPPPRVIDRISNSKARAFLHALPPKMPRPFEQKFRNTERLALDLLQQLLAFDPADRPSASQALEHPYFQVGACCRLRNTL